MGDLTHPDDANLGISYVFWVIDSLPCSSPFLQRVESTGGPMVIAQHPCPLG